MRWRITLDELAALTHVSARELDHWTELGAMGLRWRESREQGRWRHITKEVARRAVIMSKLRAAGVDEHVAARAARELDVKNPHLQSITFDASPDVTITITIETWP